MKPDRPEALAEKVLAALDRLARAHRINRQANAGAHGLSPLQVELLTTLAEGPPPRAHVGPLAAEIGVTQPTATDSLASLEQKGLVTRRRDTADSRRTSCQLTPAGRRLARNLDRADTGFVTAIEALPRDTQADMLEALLNLIAHLVGTGAIAISRTCFTCHHYQRKGTTHTCTLIGADLAAADLRVNCPEHQPA
ncbi:MAG: winged helix-turn-helix transcriptional regulator [Acidimicrobiia bacterium]|nr:winged helix-turn-helix transcriptional regulator [Acidimicrobiia bacterium]